MDYLNMKIADITPKWIRKNFDVAAEQTEITRKVETTIYLFDMMFTMPLNEFFDKLNQVDRDYRGEHACLNRRNPDEIVTKIHHSVYTDYDGAYDEYREERHTFVLVFEYQELETEKETVERLREEVQKKIRDEKAKVKAAERKATLRQKKAALKKLEIENEFALYQKLKKKFEE